MKQDILIIAEHKNERPLPITFEMLSLARTIQENHPGNIIYVVLENPGSTVSRQIADVTGLDVIAVPTEQTGPLSGEICLLALTEVLSERTFAYVCIPHTSLGIDYASRLAIRLGASGISGVNGIDSKNGRILFQRPILGGKMNEQIRPECPETVLTILPGLFPIPAFSTTDPGRIRVAVVKQLALQINFIKRLAGNDRADGLAEARVVVAAGNGIGEKEHLELVKQLAELFPQSAVAGSRPVCDRGWLPHNRQVGVTGVQISPELYIACGISGAYQHVVGIQGSKLVVAINSDPRAAIFNVADIGIVADLREFIPVFIEAAGQVPVKESST